MLTPPPSLFVTRGGGGIDCNFVAQIFILQMPFLVDRTSGTDKLARRGTGGGRQRIIIIIIIPFSHLRNKYCPDGVLLLLLCLGLAQVETFRTWLIGVRSSSSADEDGPSFGVDSVISVKSRGFITICSTPVAN